MTEKTAAPKPFVDEAFLESPIFLRFMDLVNEYALFDLAPRVLAETARKKGASDASPRDYDCGCQVDPVDCRPRCMAQREGCRFLDREPVAIANIETEPRFRTAKRALAVELETFMKADEQKRRRIIAHLRAAAARRRRRHHDGRSK